MKSFEPFWCCDTLVVAVVILLAADSCRLWTIVLSFGKLTEPFLRIDISSEKKSETENPFESVAIAPFDNNCSFQCTNHRIVSQ